VAGVIKMIMAMHHSTLPRTLHVEKPSANIDWDAGAVMLLAEPSPWPRNGHPRRAGISGFGVGGTNAHVIVEEPPERPATIATSPPVLSGTADDAIPWVISGHGSDSLHAQAVRLDAHLTRARPVRSVDVGLSLAGRAVLEDRAVVVGAGEGLLGGVRALAAGEPALAGVVSGTVSAGWLLPVFVFPGQGSQWAGMAVELLDSSPVFAERLAACAEALGEHVDWVLEDVLRGVAGAAGLERVDVVQPALFAVMVSLAGLWRACGVQPAAVVGHSQGEIAAAHVAGGLSLGDAARIVALRSQALARLAGLGGMVSVALPASEVESCLAVWEGRVSIAAINGPAATVVSGESDALDGFFAQCETDGVRARRIAVDYASHSVQIEEIRAELLKACATITPTAGEVPFYSTVTGGLLDTALLDGEYWYRNLRETVQFEQATRALLDDGHRALIETSAHPVLTISLAETVEAALSDPAETAIVGTLRRDQGGLQRFLTSLAEAWVKGAQVDWAHVFAGTNARRIPLPTYAFQRQRYWLRAPEGRGDVRALGLVASDHPWLRAAVPIADGEQWLFTGRISLQTHPWLADHAVRGTILLPGTAFLELALHAARHVGCDQVDELILETPLVLPEHDPIQVQIVVAEPDNNGHRTITIHTRPQPPTPNPNSAAQWSQNAAGRLGRDTHKLDGNPAIRGAWPPLDSEPIDVADLYERLAATGLEYGPVFQGLRAAWRRGDTVFADIALADDQQPTDSFVLYPAMLDAALHTIALRSLPHDASESQPLSLPFTWSEVSAHRTGVGTLKVTATFTEQADRADGEDSPGSHGAQITIVDESGAPVATIAAVRSRPISRQQLVAARGANHNSLFDIEWTDLAPDGVPAGGTRWALIGKDSEQLAESFSRPSLEISSFGNLERLGEAVSAGAPVPDVALVAVAPSFDDGDGASQPQNLDGETVVSAAHAVTREALALIQAWLADDRFAATKLVVMTVEEALDGPAAPLMAPVGGLVRSAQSENPGRLVLLDHDGRPESWTALAGALQAALVNGEPQFALREGRALVPRLTRVASRAGEPSATFNAEGTVLITGGLGGLGALIARHLVADHGVTQLLLVSRQGKDTEGAPELEAQLRALGAHVRVAACDVTDRGALADLLASISERHPLRGVVHAAGLLDDGVVESLTADRVDRVLAPKIDAAWYLHELTEHLEITSFVLFSSVAATLGSPGQGSYAAANSFLDALARYRRNRGLTAVSMAWGQWATASSMTGHLRDADLARLARMGSAPLTSEEGLQLFDAAASVDRPHVIPMNLDLAPLRTQAQAGLTPMLLRGLVRPRAQTSNATADGQPALARILAGASAEEREQRLLELVRIETAAVIGHASADQVDPRRAYKDLGFDSLAAVELRNRLELTTGLRLPATLAFDHPTPVALAAWLAREIVGEDRGARATETGAASDEAIAIVGMSCRYPGGVRSPQELWQLVSSGTDAIAAFPADRGWNLEGLRGSPTNPSDPRASHATEGGFLTSAAGFDAAFFGMSPREATATDPQQRMLLEAVWEAFEDADILPASLRGTQTGVFAGMMNHGYAADLRFVPDDLLGYVGTGTSPSVLTGRVAYTFGLQGPAITVDTACSSSLVALHLACQALRSGECSLALAGGVAVMATPAVFAEFSRQGGLAVDGRCKSFADHADGAGFAEGVGVLVLERLSNAQANGHRVLGIVRGSAVNQDGASNGLTAPNGPSQERVIAQALADARLAPDEIDAVEGHGTGTRLGDPIEAQALLRTYGQGRQRPLALGSIKSNIGHAQAAAGVAGVIKMVMAMRHGLLPRTLHVDRPSTQVDWSAGAISLLTEAVPWRANGRPRRAGVSSFGISGTNAHVILEEPPPHRGTADTDRSTPAPPIGGAALVDAGTVALAFSAKGAAALGAQAQRLVERVEADAELSVEDLGYSLAGRPVFENRAVWTGGTRQELLVGLRRVASGDPAGNVTRGVARSDGRVALLFTGQGAQRVGMGAELYSTSPVFRAAFDAACAGFDPLLGRSLRDVVFAGDVVDGRELLDHTEFTQCALFALETALFRVIETLGVRPAFLLGNSIGELAAAHVAGVLSLQDACRLVAARGRLMGSLPPGGAMVAVEASETEILETLAGREDQVALAGINGPTSVVISGDEEPVLQVAALWRERQRRTKQLRVSHAFHSPRMDPMLDAFRETAATITYNPPQIPIISNVTGQVLTAEQARSPDYWVRHVRETVRYSEGVRQLAEQGIHNYLELGPDGTLTGLTHDSIIPTDTGQAAHAAAVTAVPLLRGDRPETPALISALAEIWVHGTHLDWTSAFTGSGAKRVPLPTYPFQRDRYWLEPTGGAGDVAAAGQTSTRHPLLGAAIALAGAEQWLFTGRISLHTHPWLADHSILGNALLPGTAYLEMALHAGQHIGCEHVADLALAAPLFLPSDEAVQLQVTVGEPDVAGQRAVAIYSRLEGHADAAASERDWTRHAAGTLTAAAPPAADLLAATVQGEWPPAGATPVDIDGLYERLAGLGFEYGPAFQGLQAAWRRGEEVFAEVGLLSAERAQAAELALHPALLDAALHTIAVGALDSSGPDFIALSVPFAWAGVSVHATGASSLRVASAPADSGGEEASLARAFAMADETGAVVATVESLLAREISPDQLAPAAASGEGSLFAIDWMLAAPVSFDQQPPLTAAVLAGESDEVACALKLAGATVSLHADLGRLAEVVDAGELPPPIVVVDCAAHLASDQGGGGLVVAARGVVGGVLGLVQGWVGGEGFGSGRLVVVTRGAVAVGAGEPVDGLAVAGVWGLVRAAQSEHPGRFVLVDVDGGSASWAVLGSAIGVAIAGDEPQVAVRDGQVLVPRLVRAGTSGELSLPEERAWRLETGRGTLEELGLVSAPELEGPLGTGEVRVEVRAAGLNFRDVLIALGVYPGEAQVGGEGAGVVVEIGPGVEGVGVGDRVMGLLPSGFGPLAVSDQRLLIGMPEEWSFAQAAALPIVFLTAYYGLVDLAGLQAGERLLVHAAAGGVGMAAVGLARDLGVEVFGTASEGKWPTLRALGLDEEHIASSRTLEFRERFLAASGGEGMDVVLDSLAREFVDASLELLPRGGRFIEMGKTDIRDAREIAATHPGVAYRAFDLMEAGPQRIQEMLVALRDLFQRGVLEPLPITGWDIRRAPEAFRYLSQARHVGKNVLTLPAAIGGPGTILITGGTGGLGGLLARHLVSEHNIEHLLLVSRRGAQTPGAPELQQELQALGAHVTIAACDVSDRDALQRLLATIPLEQPLTGVVHAAGVLDDGVIESLTPERVEGVLAAKADAAWHLHQLTEHLDLRMFVLFSSVAATLGSPGQASYAAANAFLDALAAYRQHRALPATSLAWGQWAKPSGMTGHLTETDLARLARTGTNALTTQHGLELFDAAHRTGTALLLPIELDLPVLRAQARATTTPALLRALIRTPTRRARTTPATLARRLASVPEHERHTITLETVLNETAAVLGHTTTDTINPDRPFKDLGFDSLAAVELRNRLNIATGLQHPATLIFNHPTPNQLAHHINHTLTTPTNTNSRDGTALEEAAQTLRAMAANGEREAVAVRLQMLLAELATPGEGDGERSKTIQSGSADELFQLIDDELAPTEEPA
jgi:acyl transferase domain-containing protein/D-arabinose 1-dehydrogenase-like Zn-dependent alcohol dehydrogenase/acyl carrier protein